MKGDSEWIPTELHLPPILSGLTKPPRGSATDVHSASMTHCGGRAKLLLEHAGRDGDGGGDGGGGGGGDTGEKSSRSSAFILPSHMIDQAAPSPTLSLSLSPSPSSAPTRPQHGPSHAPQPPIVTHVHTGLSAAVCTSKPRAKVKYRRVVNIASSAIRQGG